MQLRTFGAILRFALELEAATTTFYKAVISRSTNPKLKKLADGFAQGTDKHIELLMRLRRENTTEMLLEPITGLDTEPASPQSEPPKGTNDAGFAKLAMAMEEKAQSFFTAAAEKTSFLSEAAAAFERLAEEHGENGRRLRALS